MLVLGIESSCDETGLAVYDSELGIVSEVLYSQVELHQEFGGVVPELASRDHIRKVLPLASQVLEQAGLVPKNLDGVAYTAGPGLVGALLVGATFGRTLAWALGIPAIGVNHMEGHLLSPLLENPDLQSPFVALLISGGHTQLLYVEAVGKYRLLGDCVDDAVGEAFDKTAKILGLGYPGGPRLEKLAKSGDPARYKLPRPMVDRPGMDFSFSGLKTSVVNLVRELETSASLDKQAQADVASGFQIAAIDTLRIKCKRAMLATAARDLIIAGGVSANLELRKNFAKWGRKEGFNIHYPATKFCTDNGVMIAYAGCHRLMTGYTEELSIKVRPRWSVTDLPGL